MQRYAALLRGVSPMNAKMPELVRAFERAGFRDVKTVLASGNVIFSAERAERAELQAEAEAAMTRHCKQGFLTIVREVPELARMLKADPYAAFSLAPKTKRVITFLREPVKPKPKLPLALENARILCLNRKGDEAFSAYLPGGEGPVFMKLIERTFGKAQSTRTWETIEKIIKAS